MSDVEKMFAHDPADLPLEEAETKNDTGEEVVVEPGSEEPKENHQERRWKKLFNKLEETQEKLSEYEQFQNEVKQGKFSNDGTVPEHFAKMYADGLTMEERWKAQRDYESQRESELLEKAKQEVLGDLKKEQHEQEKWEDYIDENLELLEQKHGIDFTSGSAKADRLKRDFLKTVADLSPTNDDGSIAAYASFDKSFELWNKSKASKDTTVIQKKEIASLGGDRSLQTPTQEPEMGEGGMWGWQKYIK